MVRVSIIITTYNRAAHLRQTLEALDCLQVPDTHQVELVVVDNRSTDDTAQVLRASNLSRMAIQYVYEPRPGQSNARNTGMANAKGDIFLWTDDDVRPPNDWISAMCAPILAGEAQGVAGKIRMASSLERPWMTRTHYDRLSDTRFMDADFGSMIGANMAFSREVLAKVPAFDPELGPGALGFMDDSLFVMQMKAAGFRITPLSLAVEHHISPDRLLRKSWLRQGEATGQSQAYVAYHWEHRPVSQARLKLLTYQAALTAFRVAHPPSPPESEGCDRREIRLWQHVCFLKHYLAQARTTPKYERYGLVKKQDREDGNMRPPVHAPQ